MKPNILTTLKLGSASFVVASALLAMPAFAQDASVKKPAKDDSETIVVTGSILKPNIKAATPVTTISATSLDIKGQSTFQDALQSLAANNGPALPNSFTANGAFAGGASGISLRGLTTNSTLVLFDGLRAAYYPLADDGVRNFVDLNTIPDDIVDKVEVLRDGASSTYGADAIAGVVNIITKKQFKGFSARVEEGVSSHGYGSESRLSATAGFGDLAVNGVNAYISGFYYNSALVRQSDLPAPYNSANQSGICYQGACGPNNIANSNPVNGVATSPDALFVRPYDAANTTPLGRYQSLSGNCGNLTAYTLTAAQLAAAPASTPTTVCQQDITHDYGIASPKIERFGFSSRMTARIGDSTEAYAEFNFLQDRVSYPGLATIIRATAPTGILYPQYSTATSVGTLATGSFALTLPIYVCAARVNCTAANGTLNPNNPFAAQGEVARIIGRLPNMTEFNESRNRTYRGALGFSGTIFKDWSWKVNATAMHTDLERTNSGYVYIQHLLDVVADGTYNFVNPAANTAAQNAYIAPTSVNDDSSELFQLQADLHGKVFNLPGGPAQLGLGATVFYEGVNDPSGNPDTNGPTQRYFRLNAFGTVGHRTVKSVFGELALPVVKGAEVNLSGRYDNYSTGYDYFSPKAQVKLQPFGSLITLRGSYSKGFRAPSFAETNSLPTTGYVPINAKSLPNAFLAQYGAGCNQSTVNTAACSSYLNGDSYGLTTVGTQGLKPEKSQSIDLGVVIEPIRNWTLSLDYFRILKTDAIQAADASGAIAAYYNGTAIPAGFTVIPAAPDVNNPNAKPLIGFVQTGFVNADSQHAQGLDIELNGRATLFHKIKWTTHVEASTIFLLDTVFSDHVERYDGTLGNYNLTAGTGTPKWRGNWQNTFDIGKFELSGITNFTSGYVLSAQDQGGAYKDCSLGVSYVACRVPHYITFDLSAKVKVNGHFTIIGNMLNVFNTYPPIDPVTYGGYLYNPVVAGDAGILGRYFKLSAKIDF